MTDLGVLFIGGRGDWFLDDEKRFTFFEWAANLLRQRYGAGALAMAESLLLNSRDYPSACFYSEGEAAAIIEYAANSKRTPNHWFDYPPESRRDFFALIENAAANAGLVRGIWRKLWETLLQGQPRSMLSYTGSMAQAVRAFTAALNNSEEKDLPTVTEQTTDPENKPEPIFELANTFNVTVSAYTPAGFMVKVEGFVSVESGDSMLAVGRATKRLVRSLADQGFLPVGNDAPYQAPEQAERPADAPKPAPAPQQPAPAQTEGRAPIYPSSWDKQDLQRKQGDIYTDPLRKIELAYSKKGQIEYPMYSQLRNGGISGYVLITGRGDGDEHLIAAALGFDPTTIDPDNGFICPPGSTVTWEVGKPYGNEGKHYRNLKSVFIAKR